ncbi:hypothetical protein CcCBS67573_g09126 [Chytriomyces confervae]|uniref:Uncharacterized protein n=1 Tax=Chytriomyces confervae TaxID=246404 RepID=A0A507E4S9_9FUNG|nr:hypothetical protein CcCBS67573_g09126 [Chytriomyces confervae]
MNDASCAPASTNAAKGLVNHLASNQFSSGSSSSSAGQKSSMGPNGIGRQAQAGQSASFFNANSNAPLRMMPNANMNINMHSQSIRPMHSQGAPSQVHSGPNWANEFGSFEQGGNISEIHSASFEAAFSGARGPIAHGGQQQQQQRGWNQEFAQPRMMYNQSMGGPMMQMPSAIMQQQHQHQHPVHDAAFEQEWSTQFSRFEELEEPLAKGKEPIHQQHKHEPADLESWQDEFAKLDLEGATDAERDEMMAKMSEIWNELKNSEQAEQAKAGIQNPWDGEFEDFVNGDGFGGAEVVDPDPVTAPWTAYKFEPENPFLGNPDALAVGRQILDSPGGSLSQAALAFEAACQMNHAENSEAWMYLGKVQAENEKEDAAIIALQRSVQLDPQNLPALMSLGVSYTNEGQELQAYATLNRWLTTKYPNIPEAPAQKPAAMNRFTSTYEIHETTVARYLEAVQSAPSSQVDADLQLGLGVLFYNRSEYDKVIDCFSSALRVRSGDYLLWNRLGATLANSGRTEEAIEAYRKALELKPSFVRCRYNLGVSCINIGAYHEAAEHLLGALSLHVVGDEKSNGFVNVSENLWASLRRTFVQMSRMDLAEMTEGERDVSKFRAEFEF